MTPEERWAKVLKAAAAENVELRKICGQRGPTHKGADPLVTERREKVAQMRSEGMMIADIAIALGVSQTTIKSDSAMMRGDVYG